MRSIRERLFLSSAASVILGGLAIVTVAYFVALREINEAGDESLKQVAVALASYRESGNVQRQGWYPRWPLPDEPPDEYDYVAMTWNAAGELTYTSDPKVHLPPLSRTGASLLVAEEVEWRAFSIADTTGTVLAAQRTAARRLDAVESASSLFLPLIGLISAMAAALAFGLRHSLRALDGASEEVTRRGPNALEPLDLARQPREVQPLTRAINDLMRRLAAALDARQRFVADAAHGLRSPITSLRLQLQVYERTSDPLARRQALAELKSGTERAQRLISQLLDLSTVDREPAALQPKRIDLCELARSVVAVSIPTADQCSIDLGVLASGHAWMEGDHAQVSLLLSNLVENALRYAPRGAVVDVIVRHEGSAVLLEVVDNGPGIPPAEQGLVFDRFYRGSGGVAHTTGSGLGLAIVKAVADRHGAEVSLHVPSSGLGLLVRVRFAAVDASPAPTTAPVGAA